MRSLDTVDARHMTDVQFLEENPEAGKALQERQEMPDYQQALAEAAALSPDQETREAVNTILGTSSVDFREGVFTKVVKLYQGATPVTLVEETLEGDATKLLAQGKRDWLVRAIRDAAEKTGEQFLPQGEVTDLQIKEAYSKIGLGVFVGEAKSGNEALKQNARWGACHRKQYHWPLDGCDAALLCGSVPLG
jgi:hypothetical protein